MIKAVIFDLDGVIIDSEPIYLEHLYQFAHPKNPNLTHKDLWTTVGISSQTHWHVVEALIQNGQSAAELQAEYQAISRNIDYQAIFRPEMQMVLDYLLQKNIKIALASSSHQSTIESVLKCNHIFSYFSVIISGTQFEYSKPHPEIYLTTANRLGVSPAFCLAVEDSGIGIDAALSAHMQVAALKDDRFGLDQSKATYQITHLREILSLVSSDRL